MSSRSDLPAAAGRADWYKALSLAERARVLADADPRRDAVASDPELAERRAHKWRADAELDDDLLGERLAADGLLPAGFERVLGVSPETLAALAPARPAWLEELLAAFAALPAPAPSASERAEALLQRSFDPRVAQGGQRAFLALVRPVIARGLARLVAGLDELSHERPGALDPDAVAALLFAPVPDQLLAQVTRALILELHIRRMEGRLEGDDPAARLGHFTASLRDPDQALDVLAQYPLLARDVVHRVAQWADAGLELARRLVEDDAAITDWLAGWAGDRAGGRVGQPDSRHGDGAPRGPLVGLDTDLGDRHRGGRAVMVATFASGLKLVYKPRSLAVDARFQHLLAWLDARGAAPALPIVAVLDRETHGWMEHVAAGGCDTIEQIERFYERQGCHVALLYALEATDFHHENVIAAGEHPVLVDLETLFQPLLVDPTPSGPGSDPAAQTVLRSGLLPRRSWAGGDAAGLDLSALGATDDQPVAARALADAGTDQMRLVRSQTTRPVGAHRPILDGRPVDAWERADAIERGFRATYALIERHRDALLAPGGPLAPFADVEIRTILRDTTVYAVLLHAGAHPDALQNALVRDRLLDKLWLDAARYPALRRVVHAEQRALWRGDVPRFTTRPAARHVATGDGDDVPEVMATAGMELVARRLAAMGPRDLERQAWIVRQSIDATRPSAHRPARAHEPLPDATGPAEPARLLAAARAIGDRLDVLAVRQGARVAWFHINPGRDERTSIEPVDVGLYSGLIGIALCLAQLGATTGERRYTELALAAVETVRQRIETNPREVEKLGAFDGWGGVIYGLVYLAQLWGQPALLVQAEAWLPRLVSTIDGDRDHDVIGGAAGAALGVATLHRIKPSDAARNAAVRCGEHLLASACAGERGLAWPPVAGGVVPLTGLGHGAAGGAWALAAVAALTGEPRFGDAARAALAYERSWFSDERDNWPDLRTDRGPEPGFLHAWCHGAPGVGLARLATREHLDDDQLDEEVRAAVRATLAHGFGDSHCLCHGDWGNHDAILTAAIELDDPALRARADHLAAQILVSVERGPWRCGAGAGRELPGLMIGIAGIGYGLLRAAWPARVPSLLSLQTPA